MHFRWKQSGMRAVIYEQNGFWIGQCLDRNVMVSVEGADVPRLLTRLVMDVELNKDIELGEVAPKFFDMWERGVDLDVTGQNLQVRQVA
ncbi:MAG: hypothetical protein ACPG30_05920 [Parvibaculales bacterium]